MRKSLDGRTSNSTYNDSSNKISGEGSRPWIRTRVSNIDTESKTEVSTIETPKLNKQVVEVVASSPIILTEPSGTESPLPEAFSPEPSPFPSPASLPPSALPVDSETFILDVISPAEYSLLAREGLSRPSSPAVDSGRLSVPPPTDEASPPPASPPLEPSSLTNSPLPEDELALPSSNSIATEIFDYSTISSSKLKKTHSASSSKSGITEPTASFLAKAKPRISTTSTSNPTTGIPSSPSSSSNSKVASVTSATARIPRPTSSSSTARPRSSILSAGSGSPAAKKLRPSTAPSSIPSPRQSATSPIPPISSSSSMSRQSSRNSNTSDTSNVSTSTSSTRVRSTTSSPVTTPVGRKIIKSTASTPTSNGTPRSRAVAAAAANLAGKKSARIGGAVEGIKNITMTSTPTSNRSLPASPLSHTTSLPSTAITNPIVSTRSSNNKSKSSLVSGGDGKRQKSAVGVLGYSLINGEQIGSKPVREVQVGDEEENDEDGEEDNGKWGRESDVEAEIEGEGEGEKVESIEDAVEIPDIPDVIE